MQVRAQFSPLLEHLSKRQATVITGMRRVGKTTAVRYLLEQVSHSNTLFLDLEKVENRFLFSQNSYEDIESGLKIKGLDLTKPSVIALDEIQLVPQIPSVIKYLYDHYPIKFLLTGSSSYYLKNHFTESLAGRKQLFELHPLDFQEFLQFNGVEKSAVEHLRMMPYSPVSYTFLNQHYNRFVEFGGFPEVVMAETDQDRKAYLSDIVNAYIELDIKILSDFSVSHDLYRLARLLADFVGSRIDVQKLSSLLGINRIKMKDYLDLFEHTYFIKRVPAYSQNKAREISLQQKLYLSDTGLLAVLGKPGSGATFENAIANQLSRLGEIGYYQRKTGQEIDFVLDKNTAIEVKETPSISDLNTLSKRAKELDLPNSLLVGKRPPGNDFQGWIWGGHIF